jgi:hypothetical protein
MHRSKSDPLFDHLVDASEEVCWKGIRQNAFHVNPRQESLVSPTNLPNLHSYGPPPQVNFGN